KSFADQIGKQFTNSLESTGNQSLPIEFKKVVDEAFSKQYGNWMENFGDSNRLSVRLVPPSSILIMQYM
ncbi:hypothetical protein ACTXT7_003560, partial [Hymenolepis weldensis]